MPAEPISTATATHYTWGEVCDGWPLVETAELSIIEERMPAGASERRHLHKRSRQFFYILSGELTMVLDGREHLLIAGQGLEINPQVAHQAINRSHAEVRFLVISQPPAQGDRTEV